MSASIAAYVNQSALMMLFKWERTFFSFALANAQSVSVATINPNVCSCALLRTASFPILVV